MACFPGMYTSWTELTDELHNYVIITSSNETKTNMVWRGYIPGVI